VDSFAREGIVKDGQNMTRAIARERRATSLTWADFLVAAAAVLTIAAIAGASLARPKASPSVAPGLVWNTDNQQLPNDRDLVRARVKLATGA